jgi:ankyrin repeat protein
MLLAAKKAYTAIVLSLVKNGAAVNAEDYHGRTALHWAAKHGDSTMEARSLSKLLRQLLNEREAATGIGLQARLGLTARDLAVSRGHIALQRLLDNHDETTISDTRS